MSVCYVLLVMSTRLHDPEPDRDRGSVAVGGNFVSITPPADRMATADLATKLPLGVFQVL